MKSIILLLAGSRGGLQLQHHPLLLHKRILRTPTIRSSHLLSSRVSSDGDGQEEKCKASTPITKSKVNKTTVASQAALIAGTTIGKSLKVLIVLSLRSKTHNTFLSRGRFHDFASCYCAVRLLSIRVGSRGCMDIPLRMLAIICKCYLFDEEKQNNCHNP